MKVNLLGDSYVQTHWFPFIFIRPVHTSGSPRVDPCPNLDAAPNVRWGRRERKEGSRDYNMGTHDGRFFHTI